MSAVFLDGEGLHGVGTGLAVIWWLGSKWMGGEGGSGMKDGTVGFVVDDEVFYIRLDGVVKVMVME